MAKIYSLTVLKVRNQNEGVNRVLCLAVYEDSCSSSSLCWFLEFLGLWHEAFLPVSQNLEPPPLF
jgi:hypothetical protein